MPHILLYLLPVATSFTAWLTARIIIYSALYPLSPTKIFGFTLQGVLIKNQKQIAERIGEGVMLELAQAGSKIELVNPDTIKSLQPLIEQHLDSFLRVKLKEKMPVIASFIGDNTILKLKGGMMEEIELLLPEIIVRYTQSVITNPAIKTTITEKIAAYPATRIEAQIAPTLKHAMARVPLLFAVGGLLVGLMLAAIVYAVSYN
ncbi:MAG: hypothetical protein K9G49_16500 [Taibaiella sp.]|nr:hypothetical protein [Taibaiella sp.]